jgi:hypothetical protein
MRNELHRNQVTDTQTSGENLRDAVYHEAGHLVVAQFFGLTIREVEIEEDGSGRANISSLGRPCRSSAGPSGHTNSPHPSSREGHHYHRLVEFELPPMTFDLSGCRAAALPLGPAQLGAINPDAVHDHR